MAGDLLEEADDFAEREAQTTRGISGPGLGFFVVVIVDERTREGFCVPVPELEGDVVQVGVLGEESAESFLVGAHDLEYGRGQSWVASSEGVVLGDVGEPAGVGGVVLVGHGILGLMRVGVDVVGRVEV